MVMACGTPPCHTDHTAAPSTYRPKPIMLTALSRAARARQASAEASTASDTA